MANSTADNFRDSLYNVDTEGRRVGFYPRKPRGRFYNARTIVSVILLTLLFVVPWIRIGGEPFMLFDIPARRFVIFGQVFWPQDLLLFALSFIIFIVSIVLFTAVYGRVWCGWACPQTVFLEMVFRKIEHLIEGDGPAQKRLASQPWNGEKIKKRLLKHSIFLVVAFAVANTLLSYFIGTDRLMKYIQEGPGDHLVLFLFVIGFTAIFYFIFSRLRELACIVFCPYGRLQGVFLDDRSIVISYDSKRGEPRGKITAADKANEAATRTTGDCIDCKLCIAVCPTGIDIRNGTQLECVNCTACIDACDEVMDKVKRPRGLIRYASHRMIALGEKFKLTPRMIGYTTVLIALMTTLTTLVVLRSDIQATITKVPGTSYRTNEAGNLENFYSVRLVNKTNKDKVVTLRVHEHTGTLRLGQGESLKIAKETAITATFTVEIPRAEMKTPKEKFYIDIIENGEVITSRKISFTGPF